MPSCASNSAIWKSMDELRYRRGPKAVPTLQQWMEPRAARGIRPWPSRFELTPNNSGGRFGESLHHSFDKFPGAVLDLHHHARALVETQVIARAHREDAVCGRHFLQGFER